MKASLWFAMFAIGLAVPAPAASEKTELETLRARCAEQERQIRRLEDENSKLRSGSSNQPGKADRAAVDPTVPAKAVAVESSVAAKAAATSYTVQPGDTLERIARKTGCSAEKLAKTNGLKLSSIIRPGQVIRLTAHEPTATPASAATPPKKTTSPPAAAPATTRTPSESAPEKQATPDASAPGKKLPEASPPADKTLSQKSEKKTTRAITIDGEITYGEFAAKHGTNVNRLNDLNGLDLTQATVLAKGSELYVPAQP